MEQVRFNMTNEQSNPNCSTEKDRRQSWITVWLILASVLVISGFVAAWLGYKSPRQDSTSNFLSDVGNYGSYLQGTVASLWALAGVFLVFAAFLGQKQRLLLQREELEITRSQLAEQKKQSAEQNLAQQQQLTMQGQELELTRAELEEQRKQSAEQNKSIKRQNFENRFFNMVNLHHKLVTDLADGGWAGRDCFRYWYDKLKENRSYRLTTTEYASAKLKGEFNEREFTVNCYDELYLGRQGHLGHYFRNLYHIIKFVGETNDIEEAYKRSYTNLVRAQLSSYEHALLFYNGLHPVGDGFPRLITRFGLLHNLDTKRLLFKAEHKDYYPETSYAGSQETA